MLGRWDSPTGHVVGLRPGQRQVGVCQEILPAPQAGFRVGQARPGNQRLIYAGRSIWPEVLRRMEAKKISLENLPGSAATSARTQGKRDGGWGVLGGSSAHS